MYTLSDPDSVTTANRPKAVMGWTSAQAHFINPQAEAMVDAGSKRALDDAEPQTDAATAAAADQAPVCVGCGKSDVKYRCPRCERITCSLQCCVGHKNQASANAAAVGGGGCMYVYLLTLCMWIRLAGRQFDCNGKRDRTKYVALKKFTDADLSSGKARSHLGLAVSPVLTMLTLWLCRLLLPGGGFSLDEQRRAVSKHAERQRAVLHEQQEAQSGGYTEQRRRAIGLYQPRYSC